MPVVLFFSISFLLYTTWAIWHTRRANRREREEAERRAAAARERAYAAIRAKAEKERRKAERKAQADSKPKGKRGRPRKTPVEPENAPAPVHPEAPVVAPAPIQTARPPFKGNNVFAGEVVAFTGTLRGMSRAEAIRAVEANGGKAFDTMPASTTILVVGDNPGMNKLDKADQWIGQVRKITQEQFQTKLDAPLTLTPDEFLAAFIEGGSHDYSDQE